MCKTAGSNGINNTNYNVDVASGNHMQLFKTMHLQLRFCMMTVISELSMEDRLITSRPRARHKPSIIMLKNL